MQYQLFSSLMKTTGIKIHPYSYCVLTDTFQGKHQRLVLLEEGLHSIEQQIRDTNQKHHPCSSLAFS